MNKKNIILILAAVWGIVILYNVWVYDDAKVETMKPKARVSSGAAAPVISLELLDAKPPLYVGVKRDIFRPVKVAKKKVKRQVIKKTMPVKKAPVVAAPVKQVSAVERFVKKLSFGGFMEKAGAKVAEGRTVFLSSGDEIYLLKKGELMEGRFALINITNTRLSFVDRMSSETASMLIR
jgi:hypothetical protein